MTVHTADFLENWLAERLGELLGTTAPTDQSFEEMGLDSTDLLLLAARVTTDLGLRVDAVELWHYETTSGLARHLEKIGTGA
ncbi:acyl carrier protein [Actinophytocola sediminis]